MAKPKSNRTNVSSLDPLNVNERLYRQISKLLDQLEDADNRDEITIPQRISALIAVGRIQVIFASLRKKAVSDDNAGSVVRKYSATFAANAARRGTQGAGPVALRDNWDQDDADDPEYDLDEPPADGGDGGRAA